MNENIKPNEARVNVTFGGVNADLPDPVNFDAGDADVKGWITEAIAGGSLPGIAPQRADLRDFVVDRFAATNERAYNLIQIRPKTPFGFPGGRCPKCGR